MVYLFVDFEFTGLHKKTTPISMGIAAVATEGSKLPDKPNFYAEFVNYDETQVTPWIQENVIENLGFDAINTDFVEVVKNMKFVIAVQLQKWLSEFGDTEFEVVADCGHYDFMLFIDLFGSAFDLPEYISPAYNEFNMLIQNELHLSSKEAFDVSRERLYNEAIKEYPEFAEYMDEVFDKNNRNKHNALYDAIVMKTISLGMGYPPDFDIVIA